MKLDYRPNVGSLDSLIRIVVGVALIGTSLAYRIQPFPAAILGAIGGVLAVVGLTHY